MEKKSKSKAKTNADIPVYLTKGELKAAMIACGQYIGSFQKHPKVQRAAWRKMQSAFLNHEIYW